MDLKSLIIAALEPVPVRPLALTVLYQAGCLNIFSESKTLDVVLCGTRIHCYTITMDILFLLFVKQETTFFDHLPNSTSILLTFC